MTWSLINQLIVDSSITRTALRRRAVLFPQDLAVLSGLLSLKGHRVFGYGGTVVPEGADLSLLSPGALKEEPSIVLDYCSAFTLPGAQTKLSEVSCVRPARQLLPSIAQGNMLRVGNGSFFFWIGALRTIHAFGCAFLKTRGLVFLRLRLYNQARQKSYSVSLSSFLQVWQFSHVANLQSFFGRALLFVLIGLTFVRGWLLFFLFRRLV